MSLLMADVIPQDGRELFQMLFSAASLVVTMYFWVVRVNREKVSVALYSVQGFEGALEPGGVGLWAGRLFVANRSILPTAIVLAKVELFWNGEWRLGRFGSREDNSILPWNLPPSQVLAKDVFAAFEVGVDTPLEKVYAHQRLRFTFVTVDESVIRAEASTQAPEVLAGEMRVRRAA